MSSPPASGILGIHHLTAISSDAQRTVDFYARLLGLRPIEQNLKPLTVHEPIGR